MEWYTVSCDKNPLENPTTWMYYRNVLYTLRRDVKKTTSCLHLRIHPASRLWLQELVTVTIICTVYIELIYYTDSFCLRKIHVGIYSTRRGNATREIFNDYTHSYSVREMIRWFNTFVAFDVFASKKRVLEFIRLCAVYEYTYVRILNGIIGRIIDGDRLSSIKECGLQYNIYCVSV